MITRAERNGRTTFLRQRLINATSGDFRTVTNHVLITEGIFHDVPDGYGKTFDVRFSIEYKNAPEGLPLLDESSPLGSPINLSI